jgi:hypothetical protein
LQPPDMVRVQRTSTGQCISRCHAESGTAAQKT